ncbi:metallophosphoesterase [Motiliproteus sp. SC1-56]|uniref:metallophosphoesterase n=1 Tax=Motiliproteus sp. SC1-56 TaxID=2799565 RepID=UPI001A8C3357|nr:metallophosphoesterase [Motiliproteus sp. SC1-56]
MILSFSANRHGRDFFCGDLHGMYEPLFTALHSQGFDFKHDRLFCTGDLIDRGPDSLACLNLLEQQWFFAVRGNHEALLLDAVLDTNKQAREFWAANGGDWAQALDETSLRQCAELIKAHMPLMLEVCNPGFHISLCHASYPTNDWSQRQQIAQDPKQAAHIIWSRRRFRNNRTQLIRHTDCMLHGHNIVDRPRRLGNLLFIDTGAFLTGRVTLLTTQSLKDRMRPSAKKHTGVPPLHPVK